MRKLILFTLTIVALIAPALSNAEDLYLLQSLEKPDEVKFLPDKSGKFALIISLPINDKSYFGMLARQLNFTKNVEPDKLSIFCVVRTNWEKSRELVFAANEISPSLRGYFFADSAGRLASSFKLPKAGGYVVLSPQGRTVMSGSLKEGIDSARLRAAILKSPNS